MPVHDSSVHDFPGAGILEEDPGALALRPDLAAGLIWPALERACRSRESPWRTPVLATVSPEGTPEARILVLRAVDSQARQLELHGDSRSAKFRAIAQTPAVELCFWDSGAALQLRVKGVARAIADSAVRESAWARVPDDSRHNYRSESQPGTPLPPDGGRQLADGFAHFAILQVDVLQLEWLWLGSAALPAHARGRASWDGAQWNAEQVTP